MSARPAEAEMGSIPWYVQVIRLTVFVAAPPQEWNTDWFGPLVDKQPDSATIQPMAFARQDVGTFSDGQLIVTTNPASIDWRYRTSDAEAIFVGAEVKNAFSNVVELFVSLMQSWLRDQSPPLQRIAFGAEVFSPVDSHQDAYRMLDRLLPAVLVDPDGSSDFFYQINRPRSSTLPIPDLQINRFTKWSARRLRIGVQAGGQEFNLPGLDRFSTSLEFDINSAQEFEGVLTSDQCVLVLNELVALAQEICELGEIP